jgi:hypothetical protein
MKYPESVGWGERPPSAGAKSQVISRARLLQRAKEVLVIPIDIDLRSDHSLEVIDFREG